MKHRAARKVSTGCSGGSHANIAESLHLLREGGFRGWITVDAWEIPDPYDACTKAKRMMDASV
jgi:hypothetical protein